MTRAIALLCSQDCPLAVETVARLAEAGTPPCVAVLEDHGPDSPVPPAVLARRKAHAALQERLDPTPFFRRWTLRLKRAVPARLRTLLKGILGTTDSNAASSIAEQLVEAGVPVVRVKRLSSPATLDALKTHGATLAVRTSSGILAEPLIGPQGPDVISAHPGLLPDHRSLDSLPWSIYHGSLTGLTTFLVDKGIDTGPTLEFTAVEPLPGENLPRFKARMDARIPDALARAARGLIHGTLTPCPQDPDAGIRHRPMTLEELIRVNNMLTQPKA